MDLVIDVGNTLQKIAIFGNNDTIVDFFVQNNPDINCFEKLFSKYTIKRAIISSVGKLDSSVIEWIRQHTQTLIFSSKCQLPITLNYSTPQTLGTDRIAAAVGAYSLFPENDVLSIMAGTCLVTDFINSNGEYLGGSISPGLEMRLKSLNTFTAKLPLVELTKIDFTTGNSTENSILSGVINGIVFEIDGFIAKYSELYPDLKVILSGGNSELLQNYLKKSIFAAQNPVLIGLHKILKLNVSEN